MIPVYYACKDIGNVGDHMAKYIAERVTGKKVKHVGTDKRHYMLTGSILGEATQHSTVLGAGLGYEDQCPHKDAEVIFVRGPMSQYWYQRHLNKNVKYIADPAIILPLLYSPKVERTYKLGVIPHYIDANLVKTEADVKIISVTQPVENFVDDVLACENIVSSSLHGLIIAHVYGIPALWVEFSDNVVGKGFKFYDYFGSVNINAHFAKDLRGVRISNDIISQIPRELGDGIYVAPRVLETLKAHLK